MIIATLTLWENDIDLLALGKSHFLVNETHSLPLMVRVFNETYSLSLIKRLLVCVQRDLFHVDACHQR